MLRRSIRMRGTGGPADSAAVCRWTVQRAPAGFAAHGSTGLSPGARMVRASVATRVVTPSRAGR
ncbi:hypothetical protein VARIO8X_100292 [Burkholderiales bacterium 8X]|nr:hypothetical protein VARIO8X_100292 [Burkholderiales bacterium 8X]